MNYYAVCRSFKKIRGPFSKEKATAVVTKRNRYKGGHYELCNQHEVDNLGWQKQTEKEEDEEPPKIDHDLFEPDIYALDTEWQHQPKFYLSWSDKLADAKKAQAKAEAALDVVSAEIDLSVRLRPETYGIKRISEKAISNCIILQPQYKKALTKLHNAKHWTDLLQGAVRAADQRKTALENAVDLFIAGYNAEIKPKHSREAGEEYKRRSAVSGLKGKKKT